MPSDNDNTFVKITNKDIYNELKVFKLQEQEHFKSITSRQDIANGKVKLARWIGTTALALTIIIIGLLIQHVANVKP